MKLNSSFFKFFCWFILGFLFFHLICNFKNDENLEYKETIVLKNAVGFHADTLNWYIGEDGIERYDIEISFETDNLRH